MFKKMIAGLLPKKEDLRTANRVHLETIAPALTAEASLFDQAIQEAYARRLRDLVLQELIDLVKGTGYSKQYAEFKKQEFDKCNESDLSYVRSQYPLLHIRLNHTYLVLHDDDPKNIKIEDVAKVMTMKYIRETSNV